MKKMSQKYTGQAPFTSEKLFLNVIIKYDFYTPMQITCFFLSFPLSSTMQFWLVIWIFQEKYSKMFKIAPYLLHWRKSYLKLKYII